MLEEGVDGDFDAELATDLRAEAGGEEGVAAEGEEVVVDADALDVQEVAPDGGELLFQIVAGSDEVRVGLFERGTRGEGEAVDLAARRAGQRLRCDQEDGGDQRRGEAVAQPSGRSSPDAPPEIQG